MDHPPLAAEVEQAEAGRSPPAGSRRRARSACGRTGPGSRGPSARRSGSRSTTRGSARSRRRRSPGRAPSRRRRSPPARCPASPRPWRSAARSAALLGGDLRVGRGRSGSPRASRQVRGRLVGGRRRSVAVEAAFGAGVEPAAGVACARAAPGSAMSSAAAAQRQATASARRGSVRQRASTPKVHSLLPMKLNGIASGHRDRLGGQLGRRGDVDEQVQQDEVDAQRQQADGEEAGRLEAGVALGGAEGPVAVPAGSCW